MTVAFLAFAVTLVLAVLVSERANRTMLSTTVLFLAAGAVFAATAWHLLPHSRDEPLLRTFVELALVSVLYTDGMRVTMDALRNDWRLPGGALLIGMPLTLVITAVLAHFVAGVPWTGAWLVGAALAPTDPVFASALVGDSAVPKRVQHLLNIESGVNDGLALPIVVTLLAISGARGETVGAALFDVASGLLAGVSLAWLVARLESLRAFAASEKYLPIGGLAIGLLVLAVCKITAANEFLGAFVAGVTVTAVGPKIADAFGAAGTLMAETLKLAAVFAFGVLLPSRFGGGFEARELAFAALALVVARPLALTPSLAVSGLGWRERITVAWFGPKGFASVFFGILILGSGMPEADRLFGLVAIVVAASIVAHSSTDVIVVKWLQRTKDGDAHDS